MPIDTSMYSRPPMINLDGADAFQQGMSMRNMIDQRQQQQAEAQRQRSISDAYTAGMTKDANGNISFDGKKTVGMIAAIPGAGKEAYAAQNDIRTQDAADVKAKHEKLLQHYDDSGRLAGAALQNPAAYPQIRAHAIASGLATEQDLPPVYDENFLKSTLYRSMAGKEQVAASAQQKGLDIQQQNANTEARKASTGAATRQDGLKQKYADSLKKDLDPDAGRTGNFGTISKTLISADKLQQLMAQHPDGNLDPRQMEDYALGLANMLSGGSGAARSQVEALVPHTLMGKAVNVQEWLTNEPKGAEQQAFVKRMNETVQRERELAANQLNQIREQRLSSHRQYAKADPEGFKAQLQSYGLDPNNYDANLLPIKKAGPPPPKFDHLSDDELTKLYKAHGGR